MHSYSKLGRSAETVVMDPELEAWVWSPLSAVVRLGRPGLRDWLAAKGLWEPDAAKPADSKAALLATLAERRLPASSALFRRLARRVGLQR